MLRLERAEAREGVALMDLAGRVLRHRPAHVDRVPDLPAFRTGGGGGLGGAGPPEGPAPRNLVHVALRAFWGHPSASPLAGRGGPGTRPWRTLERPGNGRRGPRTAYRSDAFVCRILTRSTTDTVPSLHAPVAVPAFRAGPRGLPRRISLRGPLLPLPALRAAEVPCPILVLLRRRNTGGGGGWGGRSSRPPGGRGVMARKAV